MDASEAADSTTARDSRPGQPHVVVVGGGIAGLAAAAFLTEAAGKSGSFAQVTVLEASERVGGKLQVGEVGGVAVDLGAEAMLARRPEGGALARRAGLAEDLEAPALAESRIWTREGLRPMPTGHMMGVPGDLEALAASGLLTAEGMQRVRQDLELPRTEVGEDVAIGSYVAARLGREVVDRLLEPMLGGVYAGHADRISMRAALPQLLPIAQRQRSLVEGVRAMQERARAMAPARQGPPRPMFHSVSGGMGRLPLALADALRAEGTKIRTGVRVLALHRTEHGWRLETTDREGAHEITADAVVVAVPAPAAARMLAAEAPGAASDLEAVEYASMALVTMAFQRADMPEGGLPGSGFLVPPTDGRTIKASTFSTNKWGWLARQAPDSFVLRTSVGRQDEDADLALPDEELVARSLADLREAVGLQAVPYAATVTRWRDGLPQYPVGHLDRVARIRDDVAKLGSIALCGAAYDGVGIPACIASARQAVEVLSASRPQ